MNACARYALSPGSERLLESGEREQMSPLRIEHSRQPANVDADHMVVDDSMRRANTTVVTIGVQRDMARSQLRHSTTLFQWNNVGVQWNNVGARYLPTIFRGEPVKHINPSPSKAGVNPELAGVR
jgi:hypothetical protein